VIIQISCNNVIGNNNQGIKLLPDNASKLLYDKNMH